MIDIGQKMNFVPCYLYSEKDTKKEHRSKMITGKVIYVNRKHKQFTVKYTLCGGLKMKETFKFSQIGQDIHIVRGDVYGS